MSSFGTQSELYKIDLITGNAQFVATIPVYYLIWIAIDNNGKMYGLSQNDSHIYTISKQTGAATALPIDSRCRILSYNIFAGCRF